MPAGEELIVDFFANDTILSIILIFVLNAIFLSVCLLRTGRIPINMFLLTTFITTGLFIERGLLPIEFALVYIIIASGSIAFLYRKQFSMGATGYQGIMLTYMVFFASVIGFQVLAELTSETFRSQLPIAAPPENCGANLVTFVFCGFNILQGLFVIFSFSSSIGIINTILFVPFGIFGMMYLADWVRGRGG